MPSPRCATSRCRWVWYHRCIHLLKISPSSFSRSLTLPALSRRLCPLRSSCLDCQCPFMGRYRFRLESFFLRGAVANLLNMLSMFWHSQRVISFHGVILRWSRGALWIVFVHKMANIFSLRHRTSTPIISNAAEWQCTSERDADEEARPELVWWKEGLLCVLSKVLWLLMSESTTNMIGDASLSLA